MSEFSKLRTTSISISTKVSNSLSQLTSMGNSPTATPTVEELQLIENIQTDMLSFQSLLKEIQLLIDSNDPTITPNKVKQLQRSRDEYKRFENDFSKIKRNIQTSRDRLNLISDARMDIDQHNTRNRAAGNQSQQQTDDEYYLQERQNVMNSNNIMDSLINQVMETRDEFMRQRNILETVGNRLESSISKIPGINTVLNQIDSRHRKNAIIITIVSLVCLIILWFSF